MVRPVSRAVHRHTGQGGKQLPDRPRTHRMSLRRQLGRQRASGLRPPQRRHRITPGIGIHHGLQGRQQTRIRCGQRLTTASTPGRRTRPIGAAPDAKSRRPVATVSGDTPAARATSVTPPRPNSRASAPNTSLPLIQMRPQRGRLTRHCLRAHRHTTSVGVRSESQRQSPTSFARVSLPLIDGGNQLGRTHGSARRDA